MTKLSKLLTAAIATLILMHGQTTDAASAFDHAGLARDVVTGYAAPVSQKFADDSAKLEQSLRTLCEKPDKKRLAVARAGFRAAVVDYGRFEMLRIGPTREQNRQEKLLLYPDPKGLVRRQVERALKEADPALADAASLAKKSVALQGFSALELMLFDPALSDTKKAGAAFRCQYAAAIAGNISAIASAIAAGWQESAHYPQLMFNPSPDNAAYMKADEVTLDVISMLANGIEQVRDVRIAAPLQLREIGKSATTPILAISNLSRAYVSANLDGLYTLYADGGIEKRLATADAALAGLVANELRTARDLTKGDEPLNSKGARRNLVSAGFPLKNARELLIEVAGNATGLTIGFNAGDGD